MNAAQKKLQPIMPQPDDAIKAELEARIRVSATAPTDTITSFSRGVNFGVVLANDALASLSLFDFATLDQVPAVEWNCEQTDYGCNWTTPHSSWEICEIDPGTQDQRCDAINEDEDTGKSFITIDHAKRYVEIRIHLATLERKLLAELAGGK